MTSEKRFLILGSNSFSGATFCDYLAGQGYDVFATSRSDEPAEALLPYKWRKSPGSVRFTRIDLNHDLDRLERLLTDERPTHMVNFAAQSMVGQSWEAPEDWMQTNVVSSVKLFNLLRQYDHLEKYVHVTTPEVYGSTGGWVKEDHPYNPSTPYAVSRAAGEMNLKAFVDHFSFPAVSTRAANVYGPGQQLYRIIPRTILAVMTGKKLRLDGGGASLRVFVHMEDVSDATLRVASDGRIGECYHISGQEVISIRQLVEMILELLDADFEEFVEVGPERPGKDKAYMLNSAKIRDELDWSDKVALQEGLAQVIAWSQRFAAEVPSLPCDYIHKP